MQFKLKFFVLLGLLAVSPLFAQTAAQNNNLTQAQQVVAAAQTAGAATLARTLFEDAQYRLQFAQQNWNTTKPADRERARLGAVEAMWAGRAALAKSQWLSTNAAIRNLQTDISRFGGRSEINVTDEPPAVDFFRGIDTRQRINAAQGALDRAVAAGAEQIVGNDLKTARDNISTARKINTNDKQNASADHLAYVAEMIARRAYYLARAAESGRLLPGVQLQRTQLAQAASETQAAAERAEREAAQRQSMELQRQLQAEQMNRQAQSSELDRLRQQVEENQRVMNQRTEQDRTAREEAERRLDDAIQRYQSALTTATTAEAENLRRQVEDQQIALRAIQERERLNEQTMSAEIERLRTELSSSQSQGSASAQALADRQAELQRREQEFQRLRTEREADLAARVEMERQQQTAIADAQRQRTAAEAQAQELRLQVEAAQQAAQQTQSELQRAREQTQQTQAELERTRQELAQRDVETRRLRLQGELTKLAATRTDPRGLIVTLPGIFFDSGKSALKPGARTTLTRIADQLKTDETVRVTIEGHTDDVGSEESNQTLSERRATAVRDFLVSAGIPAERVTSSGRGEEQPVASNKNVAGRQQNRRVELLITNG
jgi:outer membrane protein OmpA-like peptidoglycan-associated protein